MPKTLVFLTALLLTLPCSSNEGTSSSHILKPLSFDLVTEIEKLFYIEGDLTDEQEKRLEGLLIRAAQILVLATDRGQTLTANSGSDSEAQRIWDLFYKIHIVDLAKTDQFPSEDANKLTHDEAQDLLTKLSTPNQTSSLKRLRSNPDSPPSKQSK